MEQKLGLISRARALYEDGLAQSPDNTFLMQAFALLERKEGNFDAARALFKETLVLNPRDAIAYQAWAVMESDLGDLGCAELIFKTGYERAPKKKCASLLQAWGLLEEHRENHDRARLLYLKSIQTDVRHGYAYCAWAVMENRLQNHERARELFLRGIRADPWSAHLLHAWAHMESTLGDPERACKLLSECVRVDPTNIQALDMWERLAAEGSDDAEVDRLRRLKKRVQTKLREARTGLSAEERTADDSNREDAVSILAQAIAAGRSREIATARGLFKQHIDDCVENAADNLTAAMAALSATLEWAKMETRYKYPDRARAVLHSALHHLPDESRLLQQLATVEYADRKIDEARKLYQASTVANPSRSGPYSFWTKMERSEGYFDRARELAARGLAANGDDFHLLIQAALLEKDCGNYSIAEDFCKRADAVEPAGCSPVPLAVLGTVSRLKGDLKEARSCFASALARDGDSAAACREFAVLEAQQGNAKAAAELFERVAILNHEPIKWPGRLANQ
jgi:tetratricopeptide (TPR) repeat protein